MWTCLCLTGRQRSNDILEGEVPFLSPTSLCDVWQKRASAAQLTVECFKLLSSTLLCVLFAYQHLFVIPPIIIQTHFYNLLYHVGNPFQIHSSFFQPARMHVTQSYIAPLHKPISLLSEHRSRTIHHCRTCRHLPKSPTPFVFLSSANLQNEHHKRCNGCQPVAMPEFSLCSASIIVPTL